MNENERAELYDYLYDAAKTHAEFMFWREFADYMSNAAYFAARDANRKPLPETFASGNRTELVGRDDWDMLVEAVRQLQEGDLL